MPERLSARRDVILNTAPRLTLPHNSAFKLHPEPGADYLVETDPRFASYRNFLSSDYFEKQLQLDPERNLKRYGDGFVEQQLVNDQILALTGHRFLGNYTDTEAEYMALMDAGVTFAKTYQFTPGVASGATHHRGLAARLQRAATSRRPGRAASQAVSAQANHCR